MKKALSILFLGIFVFSFITIQTASAKVEHVRSQLKTTTQNAAQVKVQTQKPQAAAAAKIDYNEEYVKKFYSENNLKANYYKK